MNTTIIDIATTDETGIATQTVLSAAEGLGTYADELRTSLEAFVSKVRAA